MNQKTTRALTQGAVIAALYVALTYLASLMGLSSGVIQVRLSEALCILPIFLPAAVPGLAVGCLLANALTGAVVMDIVLGPVATLAGALGTRLLRATPAWPSSPHPGQHHHRPLGPAVRLWDARRHLVYDAHRGRGEVISVGFSALPSTRPAPPPEVLGPR